MKIRRLAALVSAVVLALGMVTAVSATEECEPSAPPTATAESAPNHVCEPPAECNPEGQQNGECPSSEPTEEASSEASEEATTVPEVPGEVEGVTSEPTLPPTDGLSSTDTSDPDGTLPLVLIVLGVVGLAAVVLTPARARR